MARARTRSAAIVATLGIVGCALACDRERASAPPSARDALDPRMRAFLAGPPGSLAPLFDRLASVERGDPEARVEVVVFGDSHTAGDAMTSRLRVVWQARFGARVTIDARGIAGATLQPVRALEQAMRDAQLATRAPSLVILQHGTNEVFDPELDLGALAASYDEVIRTIRAIAPTAAILLLGPPDVAIQSSGAAWRTPATLGDIIAVQRAAAARNEVAFFDTLAAMGGPERMHGWVTVEPRSAFKDHVHFTPRGSRAWADALSGALLGEYERWKQARSP